VTDSLHLRQNTSGRHVYVVRSSLDSLKPGFCSRGKPHDSIALVKAKQASVAVMRRRNVVLTRVLLSNGIHWLQRRMLQFTLSTGNSFTSFCFDSGMDSPEMLVLATYVRT
jgi:hypothetical protein